MRQRGPVPPRRAESLARHSDLQFPHRPRCFGGGRSGVLKGV